MCTLSSVGVGDQCGMCTLFLWADQEAFRVCALSSAGDRKRLCMCTFCSSANEIATNACSFILRLQRE